MFNKLLLVVLLSLSLIRGVFAEEDKELPPLDPKYNGVHGMVIFEVRSNVFAYHMPLYQVPHDVQLLYKIETKDVALMQLIRDAEKITFEPQEFNLQRLMRGEKMTITGDLYLGHFERDGMKAREAVSLNFAEQLYVRELTDIKPSSTTQEYAVVDLKKNYKLYIHELQQAPSYDHIIHIDVEASCLNKFRTYNAVPDAERLLYKFINCGTMKPLYYESKDFELNKNGRY